MHRTIAAALAAVALTAACSASDTATTTAPTTTTSTTTTTTPQPVVESNDMTVTDIFLAFIKDENPYLTNFSDRELIEVGYFGCTMFDNGATADEVVDAIYELGISSGADINAMEDFAGIVGAGVTAFCPEYDDLIG